MRSCYQSQRYLISATEDYLLISYTNCSPHYILTTAISDSQHLFPALLPLSLSFSKLPHYIGLLIFWSNQQIYYTAAPHSYVATDHLIFKIFILISILIQTTDHSSTYKYINHHIKWWAFVLFQSYSCELIFLSFVIFSSYSLLYSLYCTLEEANRSRVTFCTHYHSIMF